MPNVDLSSNSPELRLIAAKLFILICTSDFGNEGYSLQQCTPIPIKEFGNIINSAPD